MSETSRTVLGKVSGLFGVRGWVKVYSETRERTAILNYRHWLLERPDGWRRYELVEGRAHGNGIVARLEGVDDRDAAAVLVGCLIAVERSELPPARKGEYYWADLEGLKVVNQSGEVLGVVSHLFETGANDVLVVAGERERLIPFIRDVIRKVDLGQKVIEVDWDADF